MVKSIIIFWKIKAMLQINIYALMTNLKCTKGYSNSHGFVQLFSLKKYIYHYGITSMFHVGYLASETAHFSYYNIKNKILYKASRNIQSPGEKRSQMSGTTRGHFKGFIMKHSIHHYKRLLIV